VSCDRTYTAALVSHLHQACTDANPSYYGALGGHGPAVAADDDDDDDDDTPPTAATKMEVLSTAL